MANALYAVIMAGGSGTRFWPASRKSLPKQFLKVGSDRSLLRETWERLNGIVDTENILVACGRSQGALVQAELPDLSPDNLILEPVGRDTLPCLALAQRVILERSPQAVQVVLPADHVISPTDCFVTTVRAAVRAADEGDCLVTLGAPATAPETGYGYIRPGATCGEVDGVEVFEVDRFIEKPDTTRAQILISEGGHLWNSGIFVWSTPAFTRALEEHQPELWRGVTETASADLDTWFESLTPLSVDVGILEQVSGCKVVRATFQWSDVGSWPALEDVLPDEGDGNRRGGGGELLTLDAENNVVHGPEGHLTALIGVSDLVVVHADGATLVCPKDRAQEVRALVSRLGQSSPDRV